MSQRWQIRVQAEDFDPGAELHDLQDPAAGAVVSFVGIARDLSDGFAVDHITLEHYPGMTERSLEALMAQARERFDLVDARIVHRHGELAPGDRIVFVAAASRHRDQAFEACRYLIDILKTAAPFWKRESGATGERWVQARDSDAAATERWEAGQGAPKR